MRPPWACSLPARPSTDTSGSATQPHLRITTVTVPAGQFDFFGIAAHEISEAMGRSLAVGKTISGFANVYYPLDLFHYSAADVRTFAGTQTGYFSIDGGVTNLDNFNTTIGHDFGDWATSAGNVAFRAVSNSGVVNAVSVTDLTELDILGYQLNTGLLSELSLNQPQS
jgi:hypothetical protein